MNALDLLRSGGVVGGGGAGFPTWKKLSTPAETLIINGAECEPLLQSDQYLMLHQAKRLVRAALALGKIVGAANIVIALKDHYTSQRASLERAAQGCPVAIHPLPTVYPVGDEQSVVYECTGKVVPPGGLPGAVGCTVVSVSTALNALAALEGVPVTKRLLTVAGEVRRPGLYEAPVGISVSEVIAAAGGATDAGARVMLGGPMMGALQPVHGDPVVTKTCGGILVLPAEHLLVRFARMEPESMRSRARSCCIQCRCCTDLCPRYLLGHPIFPHLTMRAFGMGAGPEPSAALCMECGVCELFACPMGLNPRRIQQLAKEELRSLGRKPAFSMEDQQREYRQWRQLPSDRLAQRLQLDDYAFPMPDSAVPLPARAVRVLLKQHIGAPATPLVRVGDRVRAGQEIGSMVDGQLGASIHASIEGVVTEVAEAVTIREEAVQ